MVVFISRFCGDTFRKQISAVCIIAASFLFAAIALNALCDHAMAGTETGEFCPDCPDHSVDGYYTWLDKEDAYNRANHLGPYAGTPNTNNIDSSNNINSKKTNTEKPQPAEYPAQEIITYPGSSIKGFTIIDVRSPEEYARGHIQGARNIYWESLLPEGKLDPYLAESALCKIGINNTDRILIYGGTDEGASFMFWTLSYLGHKMVSRLDGGANAAWSAGIKPSMSSPVIKKSNYTIHIVPELLISESSLGALLALQKTGILDARGFVDYGLSRLTNRSVSLQTSDIYDGAKMKDINSLKAVLDGHGLSSKDTLLIYGTPQAYDLFYGLRLMGYNATLLEGDWWSETRWALSNVKR